LPFETLDLGGEWVSITGLPMVFAVWAGRAPAVCRAMGAGVCRILPLWLENVEDMVQAETRTRCFRRSDPALLHAAHCLRVWAIGLRGNAAVPAARAESGSGQLLPKSGIAASGVRDRTGGALLSTFFTSASLMSIACVGACVGACLGGDWEKAENLSQNDDADRC